MSLPTLHVTFEGYANMLSKDYVLASAGGSITWDTFNGPADTILPKQALRHGMELCSRLMTAQMAGFLGVQD